MLTCVSCLRRSVVRVFALVLLGIVALSSISNLITNGFASSLSYQQDVGVSFTFNPTIRLTLSSPDIFINNLAPGTASDSNIITVNVASNNATGYTLNASVGNNTTFALAGRDLVHSNSAISSTFSSIDFGSSLSSNTELTDNTWGYAYLDETLNNGTNTTWSNYSGLPLYSDTTNIATLKATTIPVSSAVGDNVKFKIAAKSSTMQTSGEYNNVINFTVVANPIPKTLAMAYADAGKEKYMGYYKMQDMTSDICDATDIVGEGSVLELIDIRDNSVYTATKFADDKCWMTKNLRLDFSNPAVTITTENTNNPTAAFMAAANAHPAATNPSSATPWCTTNTDVCLDQLLYSTVNIGDTTTDSTGHTYDDYGVYYNWYTATAGNGTYEMAVGDTVGDLCPYGWRLPTGNTNGDFYKLNQAINNGSTSTDVGLIASPANFVYSGAFGSLDSRGSNGVLWSSTVGDWTSAYALYLTSSNVSSGTYANYANLKRIGVTARCLAN